VEEGAIVKVSLPESDGKLRSRPALILKKIPPHDDYLLCVVSGKLHNIVEGLDILIDKNHTDFPGTNLKYPSLLRAGFLFTLPAEQIEGTIGSISDSTLTQVRKNIKKLL
jgi:mRNA interferase MazF